MRGLSGIERATLLLSLAGVLAHAQASGRQSSPVTQQLATQNEPHAQADAEAEAELQKGTDLTRRGQFSEAIPHLVAVRGRVSNDYAASFNLSLCYVATGHPKQAIPILTTLRADGHDNADVNNLLAQAYVGDGQHQNALEALQRAASLAPENEKMYLFVTDACMEKQEYALGLQVVDIGLHHLPKSARLHYQRGMFLALLDEFDAGKEEFDEVSKLASESNVASVATAQRAMFEGNVSEAIHAAREGVKNGHEDYMLLTLLGEALLRSGISPGQPEFAEARTALEKSVIERPNYASSQLALGKLDLLDNRLDEAITHLEAARRLSPQTAAVYSNLAAAYRKQGDREREQSVLAILAQLNQAQAEKIREAPGDRKASYRGMGEGPEKRADPNR